MEFLTELWLPILLSAVFVFIASSIIHMALPIHKKDCRQVPGEDQVLDAMRNHSIQPGEYMFPYASSMKDCQSPEMQAKLQRGPVGFLIIRPSGLINMGRFLTQWFLFSVLVSIFVAYAGAHSALAIAPFGTVFRVTGSIAFLAYGISVIPQSIWKGQPWNISLKFIFDGLVYGLVTGFAFAWLWPEPF